MHLELRKTSQTPLPAANSFEYLQHFYNLLFVNVQIYNSRKDTSSIGFTWNNRQHKFLANSN